MTLEQIIQRHSGKLDKVEQGRYYLSQASLSYEIWQDDNGIWELTFLDKDRTPKIYASWNGEKWLWYNANGILSKWDDTVGYWITPKGDAHRRQIESLTDLPHPLYNLETPCRYISMAYPEKGWQEGWIASITCYYFDYYGHEQGTIYYRCMRKNSGHHWTASEIQLA